MSVHLLGTWGRSRGNILGTGLETAVIPGHPSFCCLSELELKQFPVGLQSLEMPPDFSPGRVSFNPPLAERVVFGPTDACWVRLGAQKQEVRPGRWGVFKWLGGHRAGCGRVPSRCRRVPPAWPPGTPGALGHSHRTAQRCRCREGDFREVSPGVF